MNRLKFSLIFIFIVFFSNVKAQLSIDILQVLNNSSRITYVGINYQPDYYLYQPDFDRIERGLAIRTQMYEAAFKIVSHEYRKVQDLKLINVNNSNRLKSHQESVKLWAEQNLSKYDLSQVENKNNVLNYITAVYKDKSIMNELRILKFINDLYLSIIINEDKTSNGCLNQWYKEIENFTEELKYYTEYQLSQDPGFLYKEYLRKKNDEIIKKREITLKETIFKYNSLTSFKNIQDGWIDAVWVSITKLPIGIENQSTYNIGKGKIYVSKNKITMLIKKDGSVMNIENSSLIKQQKADVILPIDMCDKSVKMIPNTFYIF
jgi:hypothetical protein